MFKCLLPFAASVTSGITEIHEARIVAVDQSKLEYFGLHEDSQGGSHRVVTEHYTLTFANPLGMTRSMYHLIGFIQLGSP